MACHLVRRLPYLSLATIGLPTDGSVAIHPSPLLAKLANVDQPRYLTANYKLTGYHKIGVIKVSEIGSKLVFDH